MHKLSFAWFDWWMLLAAAVLFCVGLVAIASGEMAQGAGAFPLLQKQLIAAMLGGALMVFMILHPGNALRFYAPFAWVSALLLLVLVLFFGRTLNGATGWFVLGGFAFQPIEWAKIAFMLFIAHEVARTDEYPLPPKTLLRVLGALGACVLLLRFQPDLGGAVVFIGIALFMLFFLGMPWKWFGGILGGVGIIALLGWVSFFSSYQRDRILTFLDPTNDPLGAGYNVNQAMIAIGSGGWFGRGFAEGSQSQLQFLPESQTDFIFAVIAEAFGFVGAFFVLLAFGFLISRLFTGFFLTKDRFYRGVLVGGAALFFVPLIVHVGANMGILPATGITLPLVSYGGSSLLMTLLLLGILLRVLWEVRAQSAHIRQEI